MYIAITKYHPSTKHIQKYEDGIGYQDTLFSTEQQALDYLASPFNPAQTIAEHFTQSFVAERPSGNPENWMVDDSDLQNKTVAYNDPVPLADYKSKAIEANREEASKRIAALFSKDRKSDALYAKQNNILAESISLVLKVAKGTNTSGDDDRITELLGIQSSVGAIRSAENAAETKINNASDKAGVDNVTVSWP